MNNSPSGIEIARAAEQLRQEQETFDQQKYHENSWFVLRLIMGYSSIALLTAILIVSSIILFNPDRYSSAVTTAAGAALFIDAVGLVVSVWKGVLEPKATRKLSPVTKVKTLPAQPTSGTTPLAGEGDQ